MPCCRFTVAPPTPNKPDGAPAAETSWSPWWSKGAVLHVMRNTLYMVVERFKNKDAVAVYRRFRDRGRMAPEGLRYVSSWVDEKLERCYQLMETDDRRLLDEWMANWSDLVDFEIYPVITSKEAADRIGPELDRQG
jgi:hypothetical protein